MTKRKYFLAAAEQLEKDITNTAADLRSVIYQLKHDPRPAVIGRVANITSRYHRMLDSIEKINRESRMFEEVGNE